MTISLHASISPDELPADAAIDVRFRLALRNDGGKPVSVSPALAKLAAVASYAGIGITWHVGFTGDDAAAVPLQELRGWYGPPGNPPAPSVLEEYAVSIEPGAEHVTEAGAVWIPNPLLEPRHLAPAALDPQGMDGIAGPTRFEGQPPPLADRIPLARASVLVFGPTWAQLAKAKALDKDDFLRGSVVAFFTRPGVYQLSVGYLQAPWMEKSGHVSAQAAPVPVRVK
jgi:hypothetical protein